MKNLADLLILLQKLDISDAERQELTAALTKEGITPDLKKRVRSVMLRQLNQDVAKLDDYEQAVEILAKRDEQLEGFQKETEQALNRIDMQTMAKFEAITRDVTEDNQAASVGATLLLHTDDVTPSSLGETEPSKVAEVAAPVELSPKQAAATAIAAAKAAPTVSPISTPLEPSSPSLPEIPKNQPLPPTVAPLPPTPIAPTIAPAAVASQPFAAPPAMTEPAAA